MIVGWLEDESAYTGGAELDGRELRARSPHEIVRVAPGGCHSECDAVVAANCVFYHPDDFSGLTQPLVKIVNDAWRHGTPGLRQAVLDRADLVVFRSPIHEQRFQWDVTCETTLVPSHVDTEPFRAADGTVEREERAVWIGHVLGPERRCGLVAAYEWAERKGLELDAYGLCTPGGELPPEEIPEVLASHLWYVHGMGRGDFEPFGRTTVEAWAAGCDLAVTETTGALYWIENEPEALDNPAALFWEAFDRTVERCRNRVSV